MMAQPDADAWVEVVEPPEPELPAVVGGISPEEVAAREAEQFAKGLAQAQQEAQEQLAQAVELAKELSTDDSPGFVNGVLGRIVLLAPQVRASLGQQSPCDDA